MYLAKWHAFSFSKIVRSITLLDQTGLRQNGSGATSDVNDAIRVPAALSVELLKAFGLSELHACRLAQAPRSTAHYRSMKPRDAVLRQRIRDLADRHRCFGHPYIHILLRHEGFGANHKM